MLLFVEGSTNLCDKLFFWILSLIGLDSLDKASLSSFHAGVSFSVKMWIRSRAFEAVEFKSWLGRAAEIPQMSKQLYSSTWILSRLIIKVENLLKPDSM